MNEVFPYWHSGSHHCWIGGLEAHPGFASSATEAVSC